LADIQCSVSPITTEQYPAPAKRPKNTVMFKSKACGDTNFKTEDWNYSLLKFFKNNE